MDFDNYKKKIQEIKDWTKKEFAGIRTGAASISILDNVSVEAYGVKTPLNQLANLSIEDAKTLFVAPFDMNILKDIEKGLNEANLGLAIVATSNGIRLIFPDLTVDRRKLLLKMAKEKLEDARVRLRKERDEIWKEIQEKEKNGEISEDDKFRLKEEMEEITKEANKELDEIYQNKEEEISK